MGFLLPIFMYLFFVFIKRHRYLILLSLVLLFIFSYVSVNNIFSATRNVKESKVYKKVYTRGIEDGEIEILALHLSYSNRISKPKRKNNKLGFYVDDVWYYWADGKILNEEDITNIENYSPHLFYTYTDDLPKLPEKNEVNKIIMNEEYDRRKKLLQRNNKFLDQLYNAKTLKSIEEDIVLVRLLGFWVRANKLIEQQLKSINTDISILATKDSEVEKFLSSLKTVSGYVLKDIAKSSNTSYHSYGIAFDTLPKNNRKAVYWSWSRVNNKDWYAISYQNRWSPPSSVIKVFESYGFIWGGKWVFFDTIHFEYRPEIIYYNKLLLDREYAIKLLNQK